MIMYIYLTIAVMWYIYLWYRITFDTELHYSTFGSMDTGITILLYIAAIGISLLWPVALIVVIYDRFM